MPKTNIIAKIDCEYHKDLPLGPLLFLLCVNGLKQTVNCDLLSLRPYGGRDIKIPFISRDLFFRQDL